MPHRQCQTRMTVSLVIPMMNEARNLPHVASQIPTHMVDEIIVVDGHSVDDSVAIAKRLWPGAIHVTQTRRGKGNALVCGFEKATGDILVMIDADGSTDPQEIPKFVAAVTAGADIAKGSRSIKGGGSEDITRLRSLGNKGLTRLVNLLFVTDFTDLCYGYNAFTKSAVSKLGLPDPMGYEAQRGDGFEIETLINLRAAAAGLNIVEVASYESNRLHGVSNLDVIGDGLRILRTILSEWLRMFREPISHSTVRTVCSTQPQLVSDLTISSYIDQTSDSRVPGQQSAV